MAGVLYALGAYGSWGLLPVYWKGLTRVPVLEILAHRVIWSVAFTALLLSASKGWPRVRTALSSLRHLVTLLATSLLIGTNWLLFIFAVTHGEVLASSLGYFLGPLVNVALGIVFLRERLRPWQIGSILLAAFGVVPMAWSAGGLPWISLALALSFGVYGLLRKVAPMAPLVSLSIETALLCPVAATYRVWLEDARCGCPLEERSQDRGALGLLRRCHGTPAALVRKRRGATSPFNPRTVSIPRAERSLPARRARLRRALHARLRNRLRIHLDRARRLFHRCDAGPRQAGPGAPGTVRGSVSAGRSGLVNGIVASIRGGLGGGFLDPELRERPARCRPSGDGAFRGVQE